MFWIQYQFSVLSTNGCPWINNLLILIKRDSCLIKAIVRSFLQGNSKNDDELSSKKMMMMMMMMPMRGSRRRRMKIFFLVEKRNSFLLRQDHQPILVSCRLLLSTSREKTQIGALMLLSLSPLSSPCYLQAFIIYIYIYFGCYFFVPHQYSLIQSIHTQVVDIHAYIYIYLIP